MIKKILFLFLLASVAVSAQEVKVSSGAIKSYIDFPSKFVEPRRVDIWFPPGYSATETYPVLYMHDGQMLFDPKITWNGQSWEADEIATKLIAAGTIKPCIIVGIWSIANNRHGEYLPEKPFKSLTKSQQETIYGIQNNNENLFHVKVSSDNYLKFIVTELKPYIDSNFAVKKDRANTFIAGSSMGGLISLYAICEYPEIFGGAACISTHWPQTLEKAENPLPGAFIAYLKTKLPSPKNHKIYFDHGTETLDKSYGAHQKLVDKVMKDKGYTATNWMTKEFPGADHSEKSWAMRFATPLTFLFGR